MAQSKLVAKFYYVSKDATSRIDSLVDMLRIPHQELIVLLVQPSHLQALPGRVFTRFQLRTAIAISCLSTDTDNIKIELTVCALGTAGGVGARRPAVGP